MVLQPVTTLGLLFAGLAAAQFKYANNQEIVRKDSEIVSANFPDLDDVELHSPAFINPNSVPAGFANGTSGPTDEKTMESFLRTLADRNEWMTYHAPDFKSEEGRTIPYIYLTSATAQPQLPNGAPSPNKVRVWLQGGVHGNEPGGDQALLALLGKMDTNATWTASLLQKLDLMILPRYNPDGVAYFQRYLATGFDPNRDHTKLARRQTRDIKRLVMEFAPHVGCDLHEYSASRAYGGGYVHAADGQFSAMKNLNIHPDIRGLAEGVFAPRIVAAMEARGLRWAPYVTGLTGRAPVVFDETSSDAKIGDTSVGLSQAVMFLSETRGIMLGDQHFQRRVATGLTIVEAIVQTAADLAEEVYSTVENAREKFISGNEDIVVTDYARPTNISWTFVETKTGELVDVPIQFFNTTPLTANLTRTRPEAYLIPSAWSDIAERLRVAGVEVQTLRYGFRGAVEALNITSVRYAESMYEGVVRTTATAETFRTDVELPAGSFWVSTRQRNAAQAFVTLEPEGIDSYAAFNVLPVGVGDEFPVYRVVF